MGRRPLQHGVSFVPVSAHRYYSAGGGGAGGGLLPVGVSGQVVECSAAQLSESCPSGQIANYSVFGGIPHSTQVECDMYEVFR